MAFDGLAENANATLAKGTTVTVTGEFVDDSWQPEQGRKIWRSKLPTGHEHRRPAVLFRAHLGCLPPLHGRSDAVVAAEALSIRLGRPVSVAVPGPGRRATG